MGRFESGMEGMIDMFIFETNDLLEQLDAILIKTENNNTFEKEDIDEIFRIMHTIKGSSAMMGLTNMSTLAHRIEDMFYIIREEKPVIQSTETLYSLVFEASDLLKAEVELVQESDSVPTDFSEQLAKIDAFDSLLKGEVPADNSDNSPVNSSNSTDTEKTKSDSTATAKNGFSSVKVIFEDGCEMENLRALLLINAVTESCEAIEYEPADIETNNKTAKVIVENGFIIHFKPHDGISENNILQIIESSANVKSYEVLDTEEEKQSIDETGVNLKKEDDLSDNNPIDTDFQKDNPNQQQSAQIKKSSGNSSKGKQSLISVNLNKLDQLLDMVGEIVIAEAMVTSNPDLKNLRLDNFQKAARQLRKLTGELQDIVMSIRMIPLSGAFNKMTRIVRDMKVKLNKDVNLIFEGEDTEVDKSIIDNLNDPLMHMVRNSMDHGIEDTPEERIKSGKSAQGTVTLSAYNASGEVIIVVSDDGYGINTEKVLKKAKANKLLNKPESAYSDKEIMNMIMLPGFSTNETVTEFSGRGVGMDVVRQNIEKIGGTVSVDSKLGKGTSFTIKIPLSLAIVDGIEVSVGSSIFTIPINSIKESIKIKENQLIHDTTGKEMIKMRGQCFPLIRLHEFYNIKPKSDSIFDGMVIVVEADGKTACILVDELLGEQQVVVKPFSPLLTKYNVKQNGMAGCTILGDGSITIILDISNIILDY